MAMYFSTILPFFVAFYYRLVRRQPKVLSPEAIATALFPNKALAPITLETMALFRHKTVLITGAAGSIGSELVKQMVHFHPQQLILVDQAESPLFDLLQALPHDTAVRIVPYIADIADTQRMNDIFERHQPHFVLHAAAYKHVPMMEQHPYEAIKTNILGTKNLIELSCAWATEQFLLISTDKAVEAQSIMGMSKRLAELYLLARQTTQTNTRLAIIRFGNVIGSNGSVIPLFCKQIAQGGPVTVTHPACTRYFMSVQEACRLVFESCALNNGGEIFTFDMAQPVSILDLAKRLIRLLGLRPYRDIPIIFTGLRAGERLHEQLWHSYEIGEPTQHSAIFNIKPLTHDTEIVSFVETLEQDFYKRQKHDWAARLRSYFLREIHLKTTQKDCQNAV